MALATGFSVSLSITAGVIGSSNASSSSSVSSCVPSRSPRAKEPVSVLGARDQVWANFVVLAKDRGARGDEDEAEEVSSLLSSSSGRGDGGRGAMDVDTGEIDFLAGASDSSAGDSEDEEEDEGEDSAAVAVAFTSGVATFTLLALLSSSTPLACSFSHRTGSILTRRARLSSAAGGSTSFASVALAAFFARLDGRSASTGRGGRGRSGRMVMGKMGSCLSADLRQPCEHIGAKLLTKICQELTSRVLTLSRVTGSSEMDAMAFRFRRSLRLSAFDSSFADCASASRLRVTKDPSFRKPERRSTEPDSPASLERFGGHCHAK